MKKHIFIDTNIRNSNGTYYIHEVVVAGMALKNGDKVIAYQESDSWEAEVVFADGCWGVLLQSESEEVSKERKEGHIEGFYDGVYYQKIITIKILEELKAPSQLIEQVKNRLQINI